MSLPDISHLQAAVLDALGPKQITGRDLRDALAKKGIKKSGPGFYQLMARLEDAKFVTGEYREKIVEGQRINERIYTLTGEGAKALRDTTRFYNSIVSKHETA